MATTETKTKVNLKDGYIIRFNDDDTIYLKVTTDTDILEFDGTENGNIYIGSDFEKLSDEKTENMTLEQYTESAREFFKDWGIDETVAESIISDLTPWFEKFAVEEKPEITDAWEKVLIERVEELKMKEETHRFGLSKRVRTFRDWVANADESQILYDAIYKAESLKDAHSTYKAVWKELMKAKSELEQYREAKGLQ